MNYKLMLPSYRTRQQYVSDYLKRLTSQRPLHTALNLGTGEGDLDPLIAEYAERLDACDINPSDIAFAKKTNEGVPNLHYQLEDGTATSYASESFDLVLTLEVIEHVSDAKALLAEIYRVLKPGGQALVTCPNHDFPFTYDPINIALRKLNSHVSFGAYGYGHSWLCQADEITGWMEDTGFRVEAVDYLSSYLVGALECYLPGMLQYFLKANAGNVGAEQGTSSNTHLRPGTEAPAAVAITDALIALDRRLFGKSTHSIGLAVALNKPA